MTGAGDLETVPDLGRRTLAERLLVPDARQQPELAKIGPPRHDGGEERHGLHVGDVFGREQREAGAQSKPDQSDGSNIALLAEQGRGGPDVLLPDGEAGGSVLVAFRVAGSVIVETHDVKALAGEQLGELPPASMRRHSLVSERGAQHDAALTRAAMQPAETAVEDDRRHG